MSIEWIKYYFIMDDREELEYCLNNLLLRVNISALYL